MPVDGARGDDASADGSAKDSGADSLPLNALFAEWPVIEPGVESRGFSSFDRTGGNDDGFSGRYSTLYRLANGEHVIVDVVGPGRLNTFWFTSGESGHAPLKIGKIRIYLDGVETPTYEGEANELFAGKTVSFPEDLVFDNSRSTGGFVSWVRIPFRERLRITTEAEPFFYNAQYETFPATAQIKSWSTGVVDSDWKSVFASASAAWTNTPEHRAVPLDHMEVGAGVIESVVFEPIGALSSADLRAARIQFTWDDDSTPAVDVPLGFFFGSGLGEASVRAAVFRMERGRYENRFPMPFWKKFHVQVTGAQGRLLVRTGQQRFEAGTAGHFRAVFREARPAASPDDFEYLSFEGAGKLVGTVLAVEPPHPATDKQWWEGDLRSYADGRRTPGVHGTGHEDDHFGGWSNEFLDTPFSLPLHGEPKTEVLDRDGQFNGNSTMYRLWPGIPFLKSISHSVEHGHGNSRSVNYSSVTYFYGIQNPLLVATDHLRVCSQEERQAHGYTASQEFTGETLRSSFEGRYPATLEACHVSHSGTAVFRLNVLPQSSGVYLRRVFDQGKGRQMARVRVDGQLVGVWYTPEENQTRRWAERDYFIPPVFLKGRENVEIGIDPVTGSPPWDAAEYSALSVAQR